MPPELRVLFVDDEEGVRLGCGQALKLADIDVETLETAEEALERLVADFPGILVSDVRLPGIDGLALLARVAEIDPELPVILITGHGDIEMAVAAMRGGAYDFIEKPFSSEDLIARVRRGLEKRRLSLEVRRLRSTLENRPGIEDILHGRTPVIDGVRRLILELAGTDADVLVWGETGTGKELTARCLHSFGPRRARNFVAINCAALPETLFESELFGFEAGAFTGAAKRRVGRIEHANGGTLFLDEVESMPVTLQAKLLRVLQERSLERLGSNATVPVDCRVIAATKEDLAKLASEGRFRLDLYYRLNVVTLRLPALRERRDDIPLLFEHFALQAAARYGRQMPERRGEHLHELLAHPWPGNVRELRNAAERFVLGLWNAPGTPAGANGAQSLAELVDAFEKRVIEEELRRKQGNVADVSEALKVPKKTLYDKLRRLDIRPDDFR